MFLFFIILFFITAATSPVLAVLSWWPGFCIDFLFVFGTTKSCNFFLPFHTNAHTNIFFLSFDGNLFLRRWPELKGGRRLALMGVRFDALAPLTWEEYSWDIMKPIT
jgi:hypothetical protein